MNGVEKTIVSFLTREILHDPAAPMTVDRLLLEDGILDSLGLQQLVMFLEKEFSLKLTDDHLVPENFQSVGAIAALVVSVGSRRVGS